MKKLGDFGDKAVAIERADKLVIEGYEVVVTAKYPVYAGTGERFIIWGTRSRTVFTGGWNRVAK